jgi:hypothetical protein
VSRWIAYTADPQVIEWKGIAPDKFIPVTSEDLKNGIDPVLDFAIAWLAGQ